jgi:hypothetical protein
MDPGRWRQIEQLYHSALEAGPTQRDRVLTEACREDTDLRREVESLLAQVTSTEALADLSAWAAASELAAAHLEARRRFGAIRDSRVGGNRRDGVSLSTVETHASRTPHVQ